MCIMTILVWYVSIGILYQHMPAYQYQPPIKFTYFFGNKLYFSQLKGIIKVYSPSWEKLNLVPDGDVMLEPEENGELTTVSWRPPAECERSHSFASSWLRSCDDGVYLHKSQPGLAFAQKYLAWPNYKSILEKTAKLKRSLSLPEHTFSCQ